MTGTYTLAAAMVNQLNRVDTISNNLANLNTTGFKEMNLSEGSFNKYYEEAKLNNERIDPYANAVNTIPKQNELYVNEEMGPMIPTGNRLDFALKEPNTFFRLQDKNGNEFLTRDGSFKNVDGFLVNSNGFNVLSTDGEPIAIEEGFEEQIGIAQTQYTNLDKVGNNAYSVKSEAEVNEVFISEENVYQGSIEGSNINQVISMVSLIESQRKFDQAQKAVKTIGEMNQTLIEKLGKDS